MTLALLLGKEHYCAVLCPQGRSLKRDYDPIDRFWTAGDEPEYCELSRLRTRHATVRAAQRRFGDRLVEVRLRRTGKTCQTIFEHPHA